MFVTSSQFYVFIACITYGIISGSIIVMVEAFKPLIKVNVIKIILDVFAFILLGIGYVFYAYLLNFPNFRAYMFFGVIIGAFLSNKSFYFILAKLGKNIYNIYVRSKRKKQNARKRI